MEGGWHEGEGYFRINHTLAKLDNFFSTGKLCFSAPE